MKITKFRSRKQGSRQSGQVMLFVVFALGIFVLGAVAFAVDLSYLWFRRQAAQTAADAACTAGAMDLLVDATNGTTNQGHFTAGASPVPFDCNATTPNSNSPGNTNPAPCVYAALNGFTATVANGSTDLGNNVFVDFPATVSGVTAPPTSIAPTAFMRVTVTDNAPTFFVRMIGSLTQQSVRGVALCGVTQAAAPIPILVLDPNSPNSNPAQSALKIRGSGQIAILGGPTRSIQVNSSANSGSCVTSSNCAVNGTWGSEQIDLHLAGPSGQGADMGISGAPTTAPGGFIPGNGHWLAPVAPIMDPFALVCFPGQTANCTATMNGFPAPSVPPAPLPPVDEGAARFGATACTAIPCSVAYRDHGCPDISANRTNGKCLLYTPGNYPAGISISGGAQTALFDPGLYYISNGLSLGSLSTVRPGTGDGDGSGGVTFYFNGTGTINVTANSGTKSGLDDFNTLLGPVDSTGTQYPNDATHKNTTYQQGVKCDNTTVVPAALLNGGAGLNIGSDSSNSPAVQNGANLLMGPCTGYYGDPLGANEPASIGLQRWFLFFQDRSATGLNGNNCSSNNSPCFQGNGQFLLAGTMYFHSCNSSGSGVGCVQPPVPATNSSYYQDIFQIQGNSSSGTYVLGEIVVDNLSLGGGGAIKMFLNPTTAFNILKASLYQ